jgi:hypothetical protein
MFNYYERLVGGTISPLWVGRGCLLMAQELSVTPTLSGIAMPLRDKIMQID